MVVEFFGLPGAGKSTLCQRVADILHKHDSSDRKVSCRLAHANATWSCTMARIASSFLYLLLRPRHATLSTIDIINTMQKTPLDCVKVIVNWLFVSSIDLARPPCLRDYRN